MYDVKKGENPFEILRDKQVQTGFPCGGNGTCGKCKIRVVKGVLPITSQEKKVISKQELQQHIRLACCHTSCENDIAFECLDETVRKYAIEGIQNKSFHGLKEQGTAIAIDLGTTTIAIEVLDLMEGKVLAEITCLNPQSIYGADVITRIDSCKKHGINIVQNILLQELEKQILPFVNASLVRITLCGNPTMTHIFMGEDPTSIAQAPYTCKVMDDVVLSSKSLFPQWKQDVPIQVLPPISAYVGSDIGMGLYTMKVFADDKVSLFVDLGTNGEIALTKQGQVAVASAACGPAFEGGNMQCGSGAVEGAICDVTYTTSWEFETIGQKVVCGICGSGYLALIRTALEQGCIDSSGYLSETIQLHEHAVLTQKDVREFQLAKSAVASAIHCLCQTCDVHPKDIEQVYLAGGFASHIQIKDLFTLGMLPHEVRNRVTVIGNSAMKGTCEFAIQQDTTYFKHLRKHSKTIELMTHKDFQTLFMEHMIFEESKNSTIL